MGNVAYRVWDTEQAPVDRVQRAIKEMDKVSVINDRNFSSEFTFEFNVTKSGKLLTGAQADEERDRDGELLVDYIASFIPLERIPDPFIDRGFTAAIGFDGGMSGIPNFEMLETIQSLIDPLTPGGMWDFPRDSGFVA